MGVRLILYLPTVLYDMHETLAVINTWGNLFLALFLGRIVIVEFCVLPTFPCICQNDTSLKYCPNEAAPSKI